MVVDHIIPLVAGGVSTIENLCLACYRCNEFKGARLASTDPLGGEMVPLFNPHSESWPDHFSWSEDGLQIVGRTATGRATVDALRLNSDRLVRARRLWQIVGVHPPLDL